MGFFKKLAEYFAKQPEHVIVMMAADAWSGFLMVPIHF